MKKSSFIISNVGSRTQRAKVHQVPGSVRPFSLSGKSKNAALQEQRTKTAKTAYAPHQTKEKAIISSSKAPAAIGPYSQAVIGNGTLYVSGQLPIDPATGVMPEDLKAQVAQSMKNIIALVKAAGGDETNIVKCGLFIQDMNSFGLINEAYQSFFGEGAPARFVVEVSALPKGAKVEIDAIAAL